MKIEKVDIDELVSPIWNPRKISNREMEKLKKSIEEFGFISPVIVNKVNGHIVGGNQRVEALKKLGYTTVDVVYIEETDLEREKALNVALNKVSGEWDNNKLEDLLVDIELSSVELDLTGFDNLDFRELDFDIRLPKKDTGEKKTNPIIEEVIITDKEVMENTSETDSSNDVGEIIGFDFSISENSNDNLFDSIEYEEDTVTVFGEEEPVIEEKKDYKEDISSKNTAKKEIFEDSFTIPVLEDENESNEVYDLLVRFDNFKDREECYTDLMEKGFNCIRK